MGTLVLLLLLCGCGGHDRAPGAIVFLGRRDLPPQEGNGGFRLYAADPETGAVRRLSGPGQFPTYVFSAISVSPDGTRVTYGANGWVWVVGVDGRGRRRVTRGSGGVWSPKGDRLAVINLEANGFALVGPDGQGRRVVTREEVDAAPSWSPDGERLVYASPESSGFGPLVVVEASGSALRLPVTANAYYPPLWSPDGKLIAYLEGARNRLAVIRPDGTGRRVLAENASAPAWSRDGRRIAVVTGSELRVVDLRGGQRRIAMLPHADFPPSMLGAGSPAWSPDGRRLAFVVNRSADGFPEGNDLFVANADGSALRRLTHPFPDGGDSLAPLWVDGRTRGGSLPPATVPVQSRVTRIRRPVCTLGGDSMGALVGLGGSDGCSGLLAWTPSSGERIPVRISCGFPYRMVVARRHAYWTCIGNGSSSLLEAPDLRRDRVVTLVKRVARTHADVDMVVSDGDSLVVYDRRVPDESPPPPVGLWRVVGARSLAIPGTRGLDPLAAGDGLVAATTPRGDVVVLRPDGTRVLTAPFPRFAVTEAVLDAGRLALNDRGVLRVLRVRDGAAAATRRLHRGTGPPPELAGVAGNLAAYVAGASLHVMRLSDGRDVILRTPRDAGNLFAQLDARGLVYAYSVGGSAARGRLGFASTRALRAALER